MDKRIVLVTGIGGNVGQGILRNIKASGLPIQLIGTNTISFSAGNHFCDKVYTVLPAYAPGYIEQMSSIVKEVKADLIIPSTDYEVYHLALAKESISCSIAVSGANAASIYLDKYKSFEHHRAFNIPFADSILPSAYKGQFKECIAKPREGRGSRGLVINPSDAAAFSDDTYVIQEFHRGQEITSAFYVNKNGVLHGHITLSRNLEHGTTMDCEVISKYDKQVQVILESMLKTIEIRGGANLQSIVTEDGRIVPFEVNCRISGTNSIRSQFGFKDVYYTLQEYLYGQEPDKPNVKPGRAIRILMDIIYPEHGDDTQSYIF